MRKVSLMVLFIVSFSFAQSFEEGIKKFFSRTGFVIKVEKDEAFIDMGKGQVKEGEEFIVKREGKEIIHPITGKVLGRESSVIGKLKVDKVYENFSEASITEGKDVKVGDRVELLTRSVCYEGSDEGFFKVSSFVDGLKKGSGCTYTVKEFKDGYGIEFMNSPVAFYPVDQRSVSLQKASLQDLKLLARSKFVKALPSIPISADVGDLMGNGKDYLVVLYWGKVEVYELLKNDIVRRASYSLPAGTPVSLSVGRIGQEGKDLIAVNMISGDKASSLILKMVGDSLLPVQGDIPYLMGILDKSRPKETFVGQSFDFENRFGKVVRLSLSKDGIKEEGVFPAPRGFRVDSAFYYGNYLVFTDSSGRVRVFDENNEVFSSDEGFGGSYSYVEMSIGGAKVNYVFNPKGTVGELLGFRVAFVIRNYSSQIQRFLDIIKYSRGELFLLGEQRKDLIFFKQLMGGALEEAIQSVVFTKDGRLLVLTGRTGTIPIQNKGELYEIEVKVL